MTSRTRTAALAVAMAAAVLTLPGCMLAIGSNVESGDGPRVRKLEERIRAAEERLGIAAPEVVR